MNAFERSVADVLEIGEIRLRDDFRLTDGWCSLKAFALLVLLENDYGASLTIADLNRLHTVGELFAEALLALAARVFKVPRSSLSPVTSYGSIPEWDSISHLRLVLEVERRFGVSYPMEVIPELKTLGDFGRYSGET